MRGLGNCQLSVTQHPWRTVCFWRWGGREGQCYNFIINSFLSAPTLQKYTAYSPVVHCVQQKRTLSTSWRQLGLEGCYYNCQRSLPRQEADNCVCENCILLHQWFMAKLWNGTGKGRVLHEWACKTCCVVSQTDGFTNTQSANLMVLQTLTFFTCCVVSQPDGSTTLTFFTCCVVSQPDGSTLTHFFHLLCGQPARWFYKHSVS